MAVSTYFSSLGIYVLVLCCTAQAHSATEAGESSRDLQGAATVLQVLTQEPAHLSVAPVDRPALLLARLIAYRQSQTSMSSAARAQEWIALAYASTGWDQSEQLKSYSSPDPLTGRPVDFDALLAALPPPADWPALRAAYLSHDAGSAAAGFVLGLDLLTAALASDPDSLESALNNLRKAGKDGADPRTKTFAETFAPEVEKIIAMRSDDTKRVLAVVMAQALQAEGAHDVVEVPDVIGMLGETAGAAWLSEIMLTAERSIAVPVGDQTRDTAQKIAAAHVDELKAAPWGLIADFKQTALYEALDKRFPSSGDYAEVYGARRDARSFYLLGLIGAGRADAARQQLLAMAKNEEFSLSGEMLEDLQAAGYSAQIQKFFQALLEGDPKLAIWRAYFDLSARLGLAEEAAKFAGRLLESSAGPDGRSPELKLRYAEALLALDQLDPALKIMSDSLVASSAETQSELGIKLARIGVATRRTELVEIGMTTARAAIEQARGREDAYWRNAALQSYVGLARELGRAVEVEALLSAEMSYFKSYLRQYSQVAGAQADQYLSRYLRPWAAELAGVYADAERWDDVLNWFDNFPYWGNADMAGILMQQDSAKCPLGLHLARALVALNKTDAANRVLRELLLRAPNDDRIYAQFLKLNGNGAITEFDALFSIDKFEERPLIWKAQALLADKNLDAALATIEQAIAIDPSDGEQGPGDRMRAYAIYARALEAQGDGDRARAMNEAVAAIRLAEQADRLYDAGLYTRAIKIYEEAATRFDGAYCIQSRLAIQLTNRGRFAEAAPHFRRAYSLMPASFGRVESHCFHCESVFRDVRAQGIAEEVFGALRAADGGSAKIEYMQGYLRKEQHQYGEALTHFRAAVGADPDYLNAWKAIMEIGGHVSLKDWEANSVALRIRELDPYKRHGTVDYARVTDLAGLWHITSKIYVERRPSSTSVYPLRASSASLQNLESRQPGAQSMAASVDRQGVAKPELVAPGLEIAETPLLKVAVSLINLERTRDY